MTATSEKLYGHILATITIIVWGTTFIASKLLLEEYTPVQVMIMRFVIAYVTLFALNHKLQKTCWREEGIFLLLALTGTTIYFYFENRALTISSTSNVSILLSAAPILTAILAHFLTKDEKMNKSIVLGAVIALFGVALVVFNGTVVLNLDPVGDCLAVSAALCWAIYSVILKHHVHKYDSIYLTRKVVFYSIITTLPMLLLEGAPFSTEGIKRPSFLFCLIFLGVLGSGICYVAWNVATVKLGIVTTNNYIYLSPFVTMVVACIILHEKITIMGILGAILIIAGVVVAGGKTKTQES
ncbi:DMT family transporter [Anaeromicropila herbilytica]|uniref:Membrane protein n=1 Tax=Anaeromicropila herbilytica TaxID=2785025 RepID=A0A7R7EP32_9FIRM|nr:DMT family transporter [Anaeromicropila herbilytica]BCN32027.1 membrane protein [Anaeromicropila herbilytica]